MGNENHDPRTGEFTSGLDGGGSAGADRGKVDASRGLTPGAGTGGSAGTPLEVVDKLRAASGNNHLQNLHNAGTDPTKFDDAIKGLTQDRSVSKNDVVKVAVAYVQGRSNYPTKNAAVSALKDVFAEKQYQEVKMLQVAKASKF